MNTKSAGGCLAVIGAVAIIGLPLLDPLTRARFYNTILIEWGFPLLVLAIAAAVAVALGTLDKSGSAVAAVVLALAGLLLYSGIRDHHSHLYYASTVTETDAALPDFDDRAPHQVAQRRATSSLSGISGEPQRTSYLPAADLYTTLVAKPGPMNPGYTALVSQEIALTGTPNGSTCRFSDAAHDRMDGYFGNSLTREIAAVDSALIAKAEDAWGWCDGDTPKVAVPVTKLSGWIRPVHVPAGVAIYDGSTGRTEVLTGDDAAELPGPVIGITYSERVNASMKTWGGNWWTTWLGQTGLTDEVKDADDTNALNASNFGLATGGDSSYVSPFTSRAASVTVDAVTVLDASKVEAGKAPEVTMYKLKAPRASNAATADRIKSDFADLPGWATGLAIQEIVPAGDGQWAASIGLNQNVTHRVLVRDDGSSCLQDARGNVVRCSNDPAAPVVGGDAAQGPAAAIPADIAALPDAELAKLQEAVTAEVLKRMQAK